MCFVVDIDDDVDSVDKVRRQSCSLSCVCQQYHAFLLLRNMVMVVLASLHCLLPSLCSLPHCLVSAFLNCPSLRPYFPPSLPHWLRVVVLGWWLLVGYWWCTRRLMDEVWWLAVGCWRFDGWWLMIFNQLWRRWYMFFIADWCYMSDLWLIDDW